MLLFQTFALSVQFKSLALRRTLLLHAITQSKQRRATSLDNFRLRPGVELAV